MSQAFGNVIGALLSERAYQDEKWGGNLDQTNTAKDYLKYMKTYLEAAETQIREGAEILDVQATIRKITAIGVKAMEVFGAPQREGHEVAFAYSKVETHEVPQGTLDALLDDGGKDPNCPDCGRPLSEHELDEDDFENDFELSPEELDALVQDGQPVKEIVRGVWNRVTETERVYHFDGVDGPESDVVHRFTHVRAFAVMPSGGHRLIDNEGTGYYVQPGWRVLAVPNLETV